MRGNPQNVRQCMFENSLASSDISLNSDLLYMPVAFQIRYKGCKGMVVEYPIEGRKLKIRPSMKKFECNTSNHLEIVKKSAPTKLFLNKHLITILEQMGIPKEVFVSLQLDMILNLIESLIDEKIATATLNRQLPAMFSFDKLQQAGFYLTSDPFFRSLLLAYFKSFAGKLKSNMRIPIPSEFGRNMLGVLDETNTLRYGQVFVQYSKSLSDPSAGTEVLKGPVLVTKNPSLHPGDVRKLVAVDVPKLHHLKDCIAFPAKGKRPHPDEMAGSDLDGDEFVVLWYEPLIFSRMNAKPMDYPTYKEGSIKDIRLEDMVKFFCEYIQNDNIGTFAHAHLVWADRLNDGIFSNMCMNIARRYPYVLDFAKHGTMEYLRKSERPNQYPDFLQKGVLGNTYHSHKVLGVLYRTSQVLEACSSKINLMYEVSSHDPDLEYPDWEFYEDSAEIHRKEYTAKVSEVLDRYSLVSEAEAFSGFIELEAYKKWRNEKSNAVKVVNKYLSSIMGYYRNLFLSEVKEENKASADVSKKEKLERKYRRASAWYMVVYRKKSTRVLSFPWVMSDILSDIKQKRTKNKTRMGPMSCLFSKIDCEIEEWGHKFPVTCEENCLCNHLLRNITEIWIENCGLNIGNSDGSVSCESCCKRIFAFYKSKSKMYCCSGSEKALCMCHHSCSPAKLVVDFLKCFIFNKEISLGKCCRESCSGFLPKNLQELALQAYSYIGITHSLSHLGYVADSGNSEENSAIHKVSKIILEEGDPIKIPVDSALKDVIERHMDDVVRYLKMKSGVQKITLTPDVTTGHMCLIVNSIGKNWQRWNLQEILLDTNFTQNLKENLNIL